MSEYLDKYKNRLKRSGDDVGEAYANNTVAFINSKFHESPTFRVIQVNGVEFPDIIEMDARVVEVERMGTLREVLFRPNQGLNIGTYVNFDNETWIITDNWGGVETTTGIKSLVQKCNRLLKWNDSKGLEQNIWCIASQSPLGSKANQGKNDIEWNKYDVRLPLGQLYVFTECNDLTKTIKMNHRFIFGRNVYEVFGVDDTNLVDKNGFGIIQFTVKLTTVQEGDDFDNRIAVNHYETSVEEEENNGDNGGMIW